MMKAWDGVDSQPPATLYHGSIVYPSSDALGMALDKLAYACLCAFIFALPWEDTLPRVGPLLVSNWIGLVTVGCGLLSALVRAQGRALCELHYWMLSFVAWSSASIFWTLDRDSTEARIGTYAQLLVLAWLIWELARSDERVLGLLQSYVLGTCVCALGTIVNVLTGRTYGLLSNVELPKGVNADRYTIRGVNPNDLGLMLALSIPMTFYLLSRRKKSVGATGMYWLQLVLCVTAILLSGSRGSTLAAAIAMLMFPLTFSSLARWQKRLALPAGAVIVACAVRLMPRLTWERFLRIGTDITAGTMTHRTQIWSASLEVFRNHPFVGVGSGAHPVAVVQILARPFVAHNTFLSVLVELGVAGELVLLGLLGIAFYYAMRMKGLARSFWIVTLLTWCVGVCDGTWEYRKVTWFLLSTLAAHAYAIRSDWTRPRRDFEVRE